MHREHLSSQSGPLSKADCAAFLPQPALIAEAASIAAPVVAPVVVIPNPGERWSEQGGVYAGQRRGRDGTLYHLIVAEGPDGETTAEWGAYGEDEPGAKSDWDSVANTLALVNSKHAHPAAEFAHAARVGGKEDWTVPSRCDPEFCEAQVPELFAKEWHWSSTQSSRDAAWYQHFSHGYQDYNGKDGKFKVRLVRRFVPSVL